MRYIMLAYNDISYMVKDLPPIAVVNILPFGPIERITSALTYCGANVFLFNLTKKLKAQSYFNTSFNQRIIPDDHGKDFVCKLKVIQNLFIKKHPQLHNDYEYSLCGENLHVSLHLEKTFQSCGLVLLGNSGMFIDADKISITLNGKPSIYWCSSVNPFTGFCIYSAGCKKWQRDGCANCPILGKTRDNKDLCAEIFARKRHGLAEVHNLTVATPSRWLCHETRQSLLGKKFPHTVIPTSVKLETYRPIPQEEAQKRLGIPSDRPVILVGSAGLRKNKGGHLLCEALRQLQGQWSNTPPRVLFFGHDAPFLTRIKECGLEAQSLGWIDDIRTMACIYAAADVFVSPSFQDNLPNTVNESLSCGTPVICFDRYSSEDVVIDGVTGFLARHPGLPLSPDGQLVQSAPYEPDAERCTDLAEKIHYFLELPRWHREQMRWECRRLAEATFSPVLEAARYLQLFRHMLGLPSNTLSYK